MTQIEANQEENVFESAIKALHAEIAVLGGHGAIDGAARASYDKQIRMMAAELRLKAQSGQVTWRQAATEANQVRNIVMDAVRGKSTAWGRAVAESIKSQGKTLNQIIAKKTIELFGESANFGRLTTAKQNLVYAEVVKSAGKSNPKITARMRNISRAGRGLLFLSLSISVYVIATAENKVEATKREAAVLAAGAAGSAALGTAGLACGPLAPVCVPLGVFVGGAAAAFFVDLAFF